MKFPWLLDVVLGLLVVAALPLAIVAIPNTVSVVADLLPGDIDRVGLTRAHGLTLPAMMLTVPLAAVALRRMRVAYVLVAGLALLAVADVAGGYAGSTFLVGVLRVLHGVGAGVLIPATLVAVWDRPPVMRALWTGMLSVSLLAAQALALWPLDKADHWQITLQPYPLLTGVALALAAAYLLVWLLQGESAAPAPRAKERSRLLLATVPAAGIAVLAISTASQDWRAGLVVLVAVLSVAALLALATIGGAESRTLAYTFVAVGVVLLPMLAQVTTVELGGLGGPGLNGLWVAFGVAALAAIGAAVAVALFGGNVVSWLTRGGLVLMVLGLATVRLMAPAQQGGLLVVPFTFLAVGAAVALTAALRRAGVGVALFGLALCFPGVLSGYLLGTGVQVMMLRGKRSAQALVDGYVEALHTWALIGGFLIVAVIVLGALLGRRSDAGPVVAEGASEGTAAAAASEEGTAAAAPAEGGPSGAGDGASGDALGGIGGSGESREGLGDSGMAQADVEAARTGQAETEPARAEAKTDPAKAEASPEGGGRQEQERAQERKPEQAPRPAQAEKPEQARPPAQAEKPEQAPRPAQEQEPEQAPEQARERVRETEADEVDEGDRPTGEIPRIVLPTPVNGDSPVTADPARAAGERDPVAPAVPPPAQSPEDDDNP
ncbi:hypothetical protein [Nonomuraea typhae]|uniref:hypothetical protein n=1 Tax=Nonomuraea typhae TaxID=2603600 RepID=UPI0012F7C281|nr:hypothetical protein [Nonomuraea typhae]